MLERELERLQAVHRFLNLELDKNQELQEIVQLASDLCGTPIGLLTFIDSDLQYYKIKIGTDTANNPRANSFCNYLIEQDEVMIVSDALNDNRFAKNPSVTSSPNLRFYAGAPLTTHDGYTLGSLCVMDVKPKTLTETQIHLLKVLSKQVIQILELDRSLSIMKEQYLKVRGSEIKLKSFFESTGALHLLIGKEQDILAFNKRMADFLERIYPVKLTTGMKMNDILQGKVKDDFNINFYKALQGESIEYEKEVDYGESKVWLDVTFEPGYDEEGEIIGILYNATDVTERKQSEQMILAQNASLRKVAYIQSHELRKPVASILGLMEVFRYSDYQASKEDLLMMEEAVKELDSMIHSIVKLTNEV